MADAELLREISSDVKSVSKELTDFRVDMAGKYATVTAKVDENSRDINALFTAHRERQGGQGMDEDIRTTYRASQMVWKWIAAASTVAAGIATVIAVV